MEAVLPFSLVKNESSLVGSAGKAVTWPFRKAIHGSKLAILKTSLLGIRISTGKKLVYRQQREAFFVVDTKGNAQRVQNEKED